jgi:hypothetical protein
MVLTLIVLTGALLWELQYRRRQRAAPQTTSAPAARPHAAG